MRRGLAVVWLVALAAATPAGGQTVFKGRVVVAAGGPSLRQIKVTLGPYGSQAPDDAGYFSAAIPAGVRSFDLRVDTGNPKWVMRIPTGAVPVPADPSFVTDIIVGPSLEETLARAYAAENAQLLAGLKTAGVANAKIVDALEALLQQYADRTHIEVEKLRVAAKNVEAREKAYPRIAAALVAYSIKANNVLAAFRYVLEPSFGSEAAFGELKRAIQEYNPAFEELEKERAGFEQAVRDNWSSELLAADLRRVFDYALGDIHRVQILPLNEVLPIISRVLKGQLQGNEAKDRKQEVTARVKAVVGVLAPMLEELDRRKTRVLSELQAP